MFREAIPLDSGETQTPQPELPASLAAAEQAFHDLPFDERFGAMLRANGLTARDSDKPIYWQCAAQFADDICAEDLEQGVEPKQLIIKELFAATPSFIYDSEQLSHPVDKTSPAAAAESRAAKESVSYFNGLIRAAAEQWPDMPASTLAKSLMNVANTSINNPAVKQSAAGLIRNCVRGAQHELAFGQLLAAAGRQFRGATVAEDLRGIDYVVARPDGRGADFVDVKASLSEIESRGQSRGFFVRAADGRFITYSLLLDKELNDRFVVPEELAIERGALIEQMLDSDKLPVAV
ncbi:MAG: hypothetical protein ACREGA_02045 [Candidatus Saccharimonadales bacterium]